MRKRILWPSGLILVILVIGVWKAPVIKRLGAALTIFTEGQIVDRFSDMQSAFLYKELIVGPPQPWPVALKPLPKTVTLYGQKRALDEVLEETDTTALVVVQDGQIIHETYYQGTERDDLRISWSVAKSFMSGLYGQVLASGAIQSLEDPIEQYVPELIGTAYEGASLANILNMSSGVRFNEDYMDQFSDINKMGRVLALGGSMDKFAASLDQRDYTPGTEWQYVSIDTHVAAMALRRVTGKSLHQLWEETYGAHLGFSRAPYYLVDGQEVAFALGGLNLTTRDYAKFGQLFLQKGVWNGEALIPADWVARSTRDHGPYLNPKYGSGYGYQWWIPMPQEGDYEGDFLAQGIYGQFIYVNPKAGLVIAKNSADREFTEQDENGHFQQAVNIEIFRSLATQLMPASIP